MGQRVHGRLAMANHPAKRRSGAVWCLCAAATVVLIAPGVAGPLAARAAAGEPAVQPSETGWSEGRASAPQGRAAAESAATKRAVLRVATSGDYAPFSRATAAAPAADDASEEGPEPQRFDPQGFDPDVARAYAADRGWRIEWVRFRWPQLLDDLAARRFDVAMSGITIRPERSIAGRFSVPVARTGAVVLVAESAAPDLDRLDRPGVAIGVNAGGHLERVARERFPSADLRAIPDNDAVRRALWAGEVEAAVTDTLEAPHWLAGSQGLKALPPFTRDRKAYLFPPEAERAATDLDTWLLAREADGTLARLRRRHLQREAEPPTATPLAALLASLDERLALMPDVARSKRRSGGAIEVPEREKRVVASALAATRRAALALPGRTPEAPGFDEQAVEALFRAQIEAAKEIQRRVVAGPPTADGSKPPDLANELRPALIRIGDRIAFLAARLEGPLSAELVLAQARAALAARHLSEASVRELADAIVAVPAPWGPDAHHTSTRDESARQ